ncbi:amino acid ABC transporter permease [Defluviimonas sp. WL0002]|uniref:Amino acid ABC transporter permease n=1 Tax=Albidovulum marisflavi TaxID=2984159 RepID=A0ABT2ZDZ7_9RHOB|nr:amino acid ABC transporter permease [Defluviimonas sp. WL0002]MCV2869339.1 amino acid ABC transporter permease [Defluviimonas sp. WL0002]
MTQATFVRKEMLAPQEPPVSERGAIKWARENLFSSPLNSLLTVVGIVVVFMLIKSALPWLLHGVWNASSLPECREIIEARYGEGATGACWAMVRERWHQYLYGFYPQELFWRPTLAFALMFVALAPVLYLGNRTVNTIMAGIVTVLTTLALVGVAMAFPQTIAGADAGFGALLVAVVLLAALTAVAWLAPRKLLIFTLLYPAIGFYLLWGGSIWGPIGTLAGFAILVFVYSLTKGQLGVVVATGAGVVAASVWWLAIQSHVTGALHSIVPIGTTHVDSDEFGGFLLAFVIGVTAIAASLPMGILLALGRRSDMPLIKALSVGFIEFIRGVPLITMLFTASLLLQYFLPPRTNFDLILRVIILVTFFSAAYIAEVIRGGLAALPRGQYEAADALGLDYWQAQRLIIMPQALKISIPGIVSSFIGLFKDTTLVALVGLHDPLQGVTKVVRAAIEWKGIYWEPYIFVGLIFFACCFSMSRYSMYLERKLKRDHR